MAERRSVTVYCLCGGDWTVYPPELIECECGATVQVLSDGTAVVTGSGIRREPLAPPASTDPPRHVRELLGEIRPPWERC